MNPQAWVGILMACLMINQGCSTRKPLAVAHNVSMAEAENGPGLLGISSTGYGSTEAEAIRDAEKAVLEQLLFRGIAGSQWALPLVPDEAASKKDHPAFYKTFLDEAGYRPYILHSTHGTLSKGQGAGHLTTTMQVDMNALRRHLEKNQIIRPFGL